LIEGAMKIIGILAFIANLNLMLKFVREFLKLDFKARPRPERPEVFARAYRAVLERAEIANLSESVTPPDNLYTRNKNNIKECQDIALLINSQNDSKDNSPDNVVDLARSRPNK